MNQDSSCPRFGAAEEGLGTVQRRQAANPDLSRTPPALSGYIRCRCCTSGVNVKPAGLGRFSPPDRQNTSTAHLTHTCTHGLKPRRPVRIISLLSVLSRAWLGGRALRSGLLSHIRPCSLAHKGVLTRHRQPRRREGVCTEASNGGKGAFRGAVSQGSGPCRRAAEPEEDLQLRSAG